MTWPAIGAAGLLATAALLGWARLRLALIDVDGDSMAPTLRSGDRVLVHRRSLRRLRVGDIVVVDGTDGSRSPAPGRGLIDRIWMIKRVAAVPGDPIPAIVARAVPAAPGGLVPADRLVVLGDNLPASCDSRHRGYFGGGQVLGVVVYRSRRRS